MKRLLCVLMAVILAVSTLCIAVSAQDSKTGFAVANDIHYVHPLENVEDYVIADTFNSNEDGYAYQHESGFIIDEFLRQCAENDECEFVLIPGDLVTYGRDYPEDHMTLAEKFRSFEKKSGKQVYVINGNHDNGTDTLVDSAKFREIYYEFGYDEAFSVDESCCSYAVNINDKYGLIALDSCNENYSLASGVDLARVNWVREQAQAITESGREPIMIMHHNLLEHSPLQLITQDKYIVSFPRTFASIFADCGIKIVFTGHTHLTDVVSHTSPAGNVIYDFCTAALSEYPMQYRFIEMTDEEISYEMKEVKSIDTDALTDIVSGYTDEQINAMATDFPAYTAKREKERTIKTLKGTISAEGLGLSEGDAFYSVINDVCVAVSELFSMPLYGENSVSQLASEYGIEIPDSDYENIWDMGGEIYLNFAKGNKVFDAQCVEVQILFNAITLASKNIPAEMIDNNLLAEVNELIGANEGIAKKIAKAEQGSVTPEESLIMSIVSPVITAYGSDTDGVDNISGTIPGYGADNENSQNLNDTINNIISQLADYIKRFIDLVFSLV